MLHLTSNRPGRIKPFSYPGKVSGPSSLPLADRARSLLPLALIGLPVSNHPRKITCTHIDFYGYIPYSALKGINLVYVFLPYFVLLFLAQSWKKEIAGKYLSHQSTKVVRERMEYT